MPTNLNALIRYKQIDLCLRNRYTKSDIETLQVKCSEQIAEYRGVYKLISERTIRDDIRIMRSDALGFNAPIVVEYGIYSYSDENYSIFNVNINEMDFLKQITKLLIEEKENIKHPELDEVLKQLSLITGIKIVEKSVKYNLDMASSDSLDLHYLNKVKSYKITFLEKEPVEQKLIDPIFNWDNILRVL